MSIPSTPVRHGHPQQRDDSDPFSSPARGVCWSPGASTTLLDGLSRDEGVFRPSTDVDSMPDTKVSPVRRAIRPTTSFRIRSYGPFTPATRSLKRNSSSQSHDSFISSDMTRFLASPTIPSSPPSARSGTLQSPSAPSSPAQQGISFYGAGLDMNELDRYYQLASPASGGSILSRSASFYTHFSSPSQDFQPSSPVSGSTITKLSSPMFPPPASPPSFATQLSSQAHTSAQDDCLTPLLPPPVSASSTYPQSPVVGPPPAPLPPSSPLPNTSSSPFEDDPFIETTRPPTRTGTLPILDNTCSLDYELPNVGTSSTAELPGPVKRRGRVYSTRARPSKTRAGPLGAGAGVTKAPRIKSKVPTRARKDKYNHPAAGREPGSSTHPGQDPVPTSASSSSMPYLSPAELLPTGLAPPPDVCATPVLTPLTPTGLGSGSSSQAISARFTLPTPAMTASFATPSTATSLATPTSTGLHCPPEVVNSYSTPASFATGLRDGAKRRRFTRHATPSPISVPEHLGMLDDQTVEVHAKAAGCASAGEEVQVPEKVEPDTEDYLTRGEGVTNVAPTNANDRPPGVLESVSHLKRSKRAREETDDDTYVAKRAKENIGVTRRNEKVKLEPKTASMDFILARPTRSQTRAVAALLASSINTERREEIKDNATSLTSSDEQTGTAPSAQQTSSSARSSKKTRGRSHAPTRGQVAGRAPTRVVVQSGDQTTTDPIEASDTKMDKEDASVPLEQCADDKDDEEPKDVNMAESKSRSPVPSRSKHIVPSTLLPLPDTATIFSSDGSIRQRTFPKRFPIRAKYEKWYRRFPVSAYFLEKDPAKSFVLGDDAPKSVDMQPRASSGTLVPNDALHFNLYTPRFVRGVGADKVGLCPICIEPVWRGGEDKAIVLGTKISAFNYHMQYYHGLCSQTGLPFSPPIAFRHQARKPAQGNERSRIEQGKCHSCKRWVNVEGVKDGDVLVPELHWWKHAASCHGKSRVEGDQNPYLEDTVYLRLREYESKVASEAGDDQCEHAVVSAGQEQASAGTASTTASASLDKENYNVGSGSSLSSMDEKKLLESGGVLGNLFGTMDSDSDLTDLDE